MTLVHSPVDRRPLRRSLPPIVSRPRGADRALWAVGLANLAAIPPTLALLAVDGRVLDHEALWLKPLKFEISMAMLALTVAFAATLIARPPRWLRWAGIAMAAAVLYELVFLNLQAARGVASHFNDATAFDAIGGSIMAAAAGLLVAVPAAYGAAILFARRDPVALSVGLGLIVGGALGAWSGSAIGANGGPYVGAWAPGQPAMPLFGWSMVAGDLRIAHFVGLHAMQGLPVIGWIAARALPRGPATVAVLLAAAGFVAATGYLIGQAQAGLPPL